MIPNLLVLLALTSSPAQTTGIELRRSTAVTLPAQNCEEQAVPPELQNALALVRQIAHRIMSANADVFYGDISPAQICILPDVTQSQRAWAEADIRTIRIEAGMLLRVQNEAQLAFVIAHELAHIALRHSPLEGNPIPAESRAEANQLFIQKTEIFQRLIRLPKGSAELRAAQSELREIEEQITQLFRRYFDEETTANWMETEAEMAGAFYYLKAGYPALEMAWRLEQLVLALDQAHFDPRTQTGWQGFNPHMPPGPESSLDRTQGAARACQISSVSAAPPRGTHRYASPCWQIWNLRYRFPLQDARFAALLAAPPAQPASRIDITSLLRHAKNDLCAFTPTRIDEYCGGP